jgi:copper ion binding protein
MEKTVIKVNGMTCEHCVKAVSEALSSQGGVDKVKVDLKKGLATVKHEAGVDVQALKNAIVEAGFTVD